MTFSTTNTSHNNHFTCWTSMQQIVILERYLRQFLHITITGHIIHVQNIRQAWDYDRRTNKPTDQSTNQQIERRFQREVTLLSNKCSYNLPGHTVFQHFYLMKTKLPREKIENKGQKKRPPAPAHSPQASASVQRSVHSFPLPSPLRERQISPSPPPPPPPTRYWE